MPLPMNRTEVLERGWRELDIVLISGDAYVDHPSFGAAVIARVLEARGLRVAILAQPDWRRVDAFREFGRPGLFFGITAGAVDSMLANLTVNRRRRRADDYSPGGKPGLRPDQATIVYANRVREAFPGIPIILGGLEASLRRLAHYDFWKDSVRPSILLESRADLLVYGMGERQVVEIASRLRSGEPVGAITDVRGTACVSRSRPREALEIPSFAQVSADKEAFARAHALFEANHDHARGRPLVQAHANRYVLQNPPPPPASQEELAEIFALPFTRSHHPSYEPSGGVPALEPVRTSITTHRGCFANCSFCALAVHQGKVIQNRGADSIVSEARAIASAPWFGGTITDLGGPTANMYGWHCRRNWRENGTCGRRECLTPEPCPNLASGAGGNLDLLREVGKIPGVKKIFVSSGLRHDLLLQEPDYLRELMRHHVPGYMKVAPEHVNERVLRLMNKPPLAAYERFEREFESLNRRLGVRRHLVRYFLLSHPGCTRREAGELARWLQRRNLRPEQVQDFYPCPMTASACMYYSGFDPKTMEKVESPRGERERRAQRLMVQPPRPR